MLCNSCGASAKLSDNFCEFCDSDLKAQNSDQSLLIRDLENRVLTPDETNVYLSIRDLSRKLRKGRFNFPDLENLIDMEEDIVALNSPMTLIRFVELLRLVMSSYIAPCSIVLFGEKKLLFQKYL